MQLRNSVVKFRKRDVYLPEPSEVLLELHGDELIEGTIVDFSDSGSVRDAYAVIEVDGMARLLMVPVDQVVLAAGSSAVARKGDKP